MIWQNIIHQRWVKITEIWKLWFQPFAFDIQVASAALYLALHIFNTMKNDKDLWTPSLEYYSGYKSEHILPIMKHLAAIVYAAKDSKNKAIFLKYSNAHFKFTSSLPEMNGARIQELLRKWTGGECGGRGSMNKTWLILEILPIIRLYIFYFSHNFFFST